MSNTPSSLKVSNRKIVYQLISEKKGLSRAEIARITQISGATVIKIIDYFVANDICTEMGVDTSVTTVGRKPTALQFNPQFAYTLSVYIEGNYAIVGLLDMDYNPLHIKSYKINEIDIFIEDKLHIILNQMIAEQGVVSEKVIGIGVGIPAIVNHKKGKVEYAPLLKFKADKSLEECFKTLESQMGLAVFFENDVNACAYGEYMKCFNQNNEDLIYISIGTGIGCGVVLDKKIRHGVNYSAGEIGNMIFEWQQDGGEHELGWLESKINLDAIKEKFSPDIEYFLGAQNKKEIIEYITDQIVLAVANIVTILDVNLIILGGVLVEYLGDLVVEVLQDKCKALMKQYPTILKGQCEYAGLIGLSHIVVEHMISKILEEE